MSFAVGRVLIFTKCFEMINQMMNVECKGISYPIRVIEEAVGRNFYFSRNIDSSDSSIIPESITRSKQENERQNMIGNVEGDLVPTTELDSRVDGNVEGDLVSTTELVLRHWRVRDDECGLEKVGPPLVGQTNFDLGNETQPKVALENEQLPMCIAMAQKVVDEVNCCEGLKDGLKLISMAHLGSKNWSLVPFAPYMSLGLNCFSLPNQSSPEEIESQSEVLLKVLGSEGNIRRAQKLNTSHGLFNHCHKLIDDKKRRKLKLVEEILGDSCMKKGKRRKVKRILKRGTIFRAVVDATSSSMLSGLIINRN
ncbi:hypothetical protein LOK49_LG10G02994 [Camellia lanceoleosa]|uniref:Uncharacterized protein n=1 Tax=Camellia lanceoleosa TaxID=1840588 RepID=A0ACC0G8P7_9ERIC|nr:hypothetical protein LOK49_LG10G02994 [Camellia lanceoleosa]